MKQAVIIYGPPGSGKGTQAELLARKFNFIHFDTGRYIESLIRDPNLQKNPMIQREKKLFDTGILCTPSWVLKITREAAKRVRNAGYNIVFSGSPRTLFEAFGDRKNQGLFRVLTNLFGKKNAHIMKLNIQPNASIKRNTSRLVCSICGLPMLVHAHSHRCSFCAGPTRKRTLDTKAVMQVRLKEYKERTYPILAQARKLGIKIHEINGEPAPYQVFSNITRVLRLG